MAKLILYGPDTKYGAKTKPRMQTYIWYVEWHEGKRRRERSTGCERSDRVGAERELAKFVLSAPKLPSGPFTADEIRIADVLSTYMEEHARHVAAPARISYAAKALLGYWGDRFSNAINGRTCRAYIRERSKQGAQPGTIRRELGTLRAALRYCERQGYLINAPSVVLPAASDPRERWLTREEVAALIQAARKLPRSRRYLPLFVMLGVYTGARSHALLSLQWQPNTTGGWVDMENGVIRWKRSETKKRTPRITPLPTRLLRMLCYARRSTMRYVLEYRPGVAVKSLKRSWQAISQMAQISDATPHTLRHTAGTWLAQRGIPMWEIAGYLGMTVETASRVYLHHSPEHLRSASRAIERKA